MFEPHLKSLKVKTEKASKRFQTPRITRILIANYSQTSTNEHLKELSGSKVEIFDESARHRIENIFAYQYFARSKNLHFNQTKCHHCSFSFLKQWLVKSRSKSKCDFEMALTQFVVLT